MSFLSRPTISLLTKIFKAPAAAVAAFVVVGTSILIVPATAAVVIKIDTNDASTTTLLYRGPVVDGDLARMQAEVAKVPTGRRIILMLESNGGSLGEGIALGRYINASKMTTVAVQGPGCHSACTFMFLAGRDMSSGLPSRVMMKGARIGFHQAVITGVQQQAYSADDINAAARLGQEFVKLVNAYFTEIKVDPEFLTLFLSSPNTSVTLLNELDALRLGIYVMEPLSGKLLTPDQFRQQTAAR